MDEGFGVNSPDVMLACFNPRPSLLMDEGALARGVMLCMHGFNPRPSLLMDEGWRDGLFNAALHGVSIHVHHC